MAYCEMTFKAEFTGHEVLMVMAALAEYAQNHQEDEAMSLSYELGYELGIFDDEEEQEASEA